MYRAFGYAHIISLSLPYWVCDPVKGLKCVITFCSVKENLHHMMRSSEDFTQDSFNKVHVVHVCVHVK